MGTVIRPELSKKNKYWIDRHRYYELMHFCLQYPLWKKAYLSFDGLSRQPMDSELSFKNRSCGDPTANCAVSRAFYQERMEMVEQTAIKTDPDLAGYIIKAVTEGRSYNNLKSRLEIPCSRDIYYEMYRRFFRLLSEVRK